MRVSQAVSLPVTLGLKHFFRKLDSANIRISINGEILCQLLCTDVLVTIAETKDDLKEIHIISNIEKE